MRAGLVILILAAPAAAGALEAAVRKVDRRAAGDFLKLGRQALQQGQGATANALFRRALELDDRHSAAKKELGYVKRGSEWVRSRADRSRVESRVDRDGGIVSNLRGRIRGLERRRAEKIVAMSGKYGTPETSRPILLELLERTPRLRAAHEALGHERIGANYVRPEFIRIVREMRRELRQWAGCRTTDLTAAPTGEHLRQRGNWPVYKVGYRRVAASLPPAAARQAALSTEAPHELLRHIFGEYAEGWEPQRVYFLTGDRFEALIRSNAHPPEELKRLLRRSNYYHARYYAVKATSAAEAADHYAHGVGFNTMDDWASPAERKAGPRNEYAWINEGFGYFLSLELFDSAETRFVARHASDTKIKDLYPPPARKNKVTCLRYVREQILFQTAYPLREVFGRSLNSLDLLASLQAWSFVRFLILYDAEGFRNFTHELRRQGKGSLPERADHALRSAFGKGTDELEPIWRRFTLEIG